MTITSTPLRRQVNWVRRTIGIVAVVLVVAAIALFTIGFGSDNVFLHQWFANPAEGTAITFALLIVVFMMLMPVQDETTQYRRSRFRTIQVIVTFLALIVWGFTYGLGVWNYSPTVIQHSPDGTRAAATFKVGPSKHLHVLVGTGLSARDAGDIGLICGSSVIVTFNTDSLMTVETDFGTYKINLDPASGRPLNHMPATCGN